MHLEIPGKTNFLASLAEYYSKIRGLSPGGEYQLKNAVQLFERFHGGKTKVSQLSAETVNAFLLHRLEKKIKPETIKRNRGNLLTLWRFACEKKLLHETPRDIVTVKVPQQIVECWTHEQLARIIAEAEKLPGDFKRSGIPRGLYFKSLCLGNYDTGLRLGDLLGLERGCIWPGGFLSIVQKKTGRTHRVQFRDSTLDLLSRMWSYCPSHALIWPGVVCRTMLSKIFVKLIRRAGLRGSPKWLRRTSATYFERDNPGRAWQHLGHAAPGQDRKSYLDPRIAYPQRPLPPEIKI